MPDQADEIAADGPERIWLGPKCEADTYEGRRWASNDIWGGGCDECNEKTVEYIRADIAAEAVAAERQRWRPLQDAVQPFINQWREKGRAIRKDWAHLAEVMDAAQIREG